LKQEALRIACARGFYAVVKELIHTGQVRPDEATIEAARRRRGGNIRVMRLLRTVTSVTG